VPEVGPDDLGESAAPLAWGVVLPTHDLALRARPELLKEAAAALQFNQAVLTHCRPLIWNDVHEFARPIPGQH